MGNILHIRDYIVSRLNVMQFEGGSGTDLKFPSYELTAYDYLDYAFPLCKDSSSSSLISCVSHLKRAADCQLDTFLSFVGLDRIFAKTNLKFEKKLDAIALAGIFHSDALITLNKKRNDLEHRYTIPNIEDVQVYYELVYAFVEVLEAHMILLQSWTESSWSVFSNEISESFHIQLKQGSLEFEIESETIYCLKIKPHDKDSVKQFLIGLNILFLMIRVDSMGKKNRVIKKLEALNCT